MNRAHFEGFEPEAGTTGAALSASSTGVPEDVIAVCVRRGVVRPERRDGQDWFACRDIAKMKLIHAMVMQARVQAAVLACYRAAKARGAQEPPPMRTPLADNELGDCARELIASIKP